MKRTLTYVLMGMLILGTTFPAQAWSFTHFFNTVKNRSFVIGSCVAAAAVSCGLLLWKFCRASKKETIKKAPVESSDSNPSSNPDGSTQLKERQAAAQRVRMHTSNELDKVVEHLNSLQEEQRAAYLNEILQKFGPSFQAQVLIKINGGEDVLKNEEMIKKKLQDLENRIENFRRTLS